MPTQPLTERADILGILVKGLPIFIAFLIGATGNLFIGFLGPVGIAILWLVAMVLVILVLYVRSGRRKIEMYTQIVNGLAYGWWQGDVSPPNHRFDEWSEQVQRLISYESRVQKDMRSDYAQLAHFLKLTQLPQSDRNEANQVLMRLQEKAKQKIG